MTPPFCTSIAQEFVYWATVATHTPFETIAPGRTFSYIDTEVVGDDGRLLCKGSFIYYNKP